MGVRIFVYVMLNVFLARNQVIGHLNVDHTLIVGFVSTILQQHNFIADTNCLPVNEKKRGMIEN